MTQSQHIFGRSAVWILLAVLTVIPGVMAQQPAATPAETPTINALPGGYEIVFPKPTTVSGFALQPGFSGDYEMHFDVSAKMLDTPPRPVEDIPIMIALADYWIVRNKPENAIALYHRGLEIEPNNLLLQNNLALMLSAAGGAHDAALDLINTALQEWPEHLVLMDTKGLIMMNSGNPAQAVPLFERCVELSCQGPLYVLHLASALSALGQDQRASDWFNKARSDLEANSDSLLKENKEMFDTLQQKYGGNANDTLQ